MYVTDKEPAAIYIELSLLASMANMCWELWVPMAGYYWEKKYSYL
jgi:hypothetical protein